MHVRICEKQSVRLLCVVYLYYGYVAEADKNGVQKVYVCMYDM